MRSTLWWLGLIFGTLSVVMLIKHGFDYGFVAPLQLVLDFYEQALHVLFGWAEPWIRAQVAAIAAWLGLNLTLYPHWKHIFVLMMVWFGADARVIWTANLRGSSIFYLSIGVFGALAASAVAGLVPVEAGGASPIARALIVAPPIVGFLVYETLRSAWSAIWGRYVAGGWWAQFAHDLGVGLFVLVVGAAALGLALVADQVPFLSEATNPALVILGAAVIVLAIYWLWWGTSFVKSRLPRGTLVERIRLSGSASVGFAMLSAFAGCAAFLAFNAGLKLAGL